MASTKTALARRMMTPAEVKQHISPFDSAEWMRRSKRRAEKEKKRFDEAEERREKSKPKVTKWLWKK